MKNFTIFLITVTVMLSGCGNRGKDGKTDASPLKQFALSEVWSSDTLFRTPESVIYDTKRDVLYVTNINLEPRLKDGNGFVSIAGTDGKIIELMWITGLNAPKGTAIAGDTLYVADIDELVLIDIEKGTIAARKTIEGIGMINDITSDEENNLYISDTDSNKIYRYSGGKLSVWLDHGLDKPNGLLAEKKRLLLASMGTMDFVAFDLETKEKKVFATEINRGDGVAFSGIPGFYLVSDWSGEIFMINEETGKISLLNTKDIQMNTADICYITDKNLLIVPTFARNSLKAFNLKIL
ncbi:MAG: ATP-binding protein [Bacteroidales bacterium]|nr:ATP-binding protein [Bacteroidales bacterium]